MKKNYEPEMGQMGFGNPWGRYECADFVWALLSELLAVIGRVYWNRNQKEWRYIDDPEIPGIEVRAYYWGEDEKEAKKPNFKFEDIEIRWYKHPGRGMSLNRTLSEKEWRKWFDRCLKAIRDSEPPLY